MIRIVMLAQMEVALGAPIITSLTLMAYVCKSM